jgi:hypothetical protein
MMEAKTNQSAPDRVRPKLAASAGKRWKALALNKRSLFTLASLRHK